MGCSLDATSILDNACSGKSACEYYVPGPDLVALQPCPRGAASYLDIQYRCIKGIVCHAVILGFSTSIDHENIISYYRLIFYQIYVYVSICKPNDICISYKNLNSVSNPFMTIHQVTYTHRPI